MVVSSIIIGAATVGASVYTASQQRKSQRKQLEMQRKANADANQRAKEAADRADIEMNKENRKRADVSALTKKEEQAAMAGPAGTLLTGVSGVNPKDLNLGGNTLLGG